jgi:hypothetical protein
MSKLFDCLVVFGAMFALDFVWAHYTRSVNDDRCFMAGVWAVAIILFAGTAQIGYTGNHWMLIPASLGAFLGTVAALKWRA